MAISDDLQAIIAQLHIAVVIPAFEAAQTIAGVLETIPAFVRTVVVVSDGSADGTPQIVQDIARTDRRVFLEIHPVNRGVGAATRTAYHRALENDVEIVVKMDADGQMDPSYLPHLILPLALGQADYAKGNRFLRPAMLRQMPVSRLVGNAVLSFVSKLSSGYWNLLDPTNGFTAISREALTALDLARLDDRFFFESSMLVELGMVRAVVVDVPIPSRYRDEKSHLSVTRSVFSFAIKHCRYGLRRLLYRYFLLDFSPVSLLFAVSLPLTIFGGVFGLHAWLRSVLYGKAATAGTVMLAAFATGAGLLGMVQAMIYDIMSVPQRPLTLARLRILGGVQGAGVTPGFTRSVHSG